ncbi:unnamed protein product [Diabrotica balteata]|uniref:Uncharacterized protein n=1 Tax=Diabrotica balteata TaxID=107213 RepID=A0A9N9XER6_DIABA|nr:unnamed protein product [Diabrotica balteata]
MFTYTLDIGYKTIHYRVDNSSCGMTDEVLHVSTKKMVKTRYTESHTYLEQFFESLPKLPSHYCRSETKKLYLKYSFNSMSDLYGVYVNSFCQENNLTPLGRNVFPKRLKENNFALYTPKKDLCNICFAFKYKNTTEEEYRAHIKRKEDAREARTLNKAISEKYEIIALTMDLKAIKLCPYIPANKMYFKTKSSCPNFTVYNSKTRDVMCYWFSENENNQLKASTFVSCIIHYLEEDCVTDSKTPVVIYSDGCLIGVLKIRKSIYPVTMLPLQLKQGKELSHIDRGFSLSEALDMINGSENVTNELEAIFIEPPNPYVDTDEDSGAEIDNLIINHLTGRQYQAVAGLKLTYNNHIEASDDDVNLQSTHSSAGPFQEPLRSECNC